MGGTLVHAEGIADPWRPAVLEAIERDFGKRWWAEALYDTDIRAARLEPHRQETNRWLGEWLAARGEILRPRGIGRPRVALGPPPSPSVSLTSGAAEGLRWGQARGSS